MTDAHAHSPAPIPAELAATWLTQSHELLALSDAQGRVVWTNAAFQRLTGRTADAGAGGFAFASLLAADASGDASRQALAEALKGDALPDTELTLQSAAGTAVWARARMVRFGDQRLWTLQDLTESRAAESQRLQLQLAIDLGRIAVWRHDLATDQLHSLHREQTMLGIPNVSEGVPVDTVRQRIHPDDLPGVLASAREALRTGRPVDNQSRYRNARGEWRHVLTRRLAQRNALGVPDCILTVALDVTHQFEPSRRADDISRRLEAAAQAARIGIWTTTLGSGETHWNPRMFELFDMVGVERVPTLIELLSSRVHPDDRERVNREARQFLKHSQSLAELEFRSLRPDGSSRWILMRADVERHSTEQRSLFGVAMDVTEHHAALAALREAGERSALITRSAGIGTWEAGVSGQMERWDEQMFRLRGMEPRPQAPPREERLASVHPDDVAQLLDTQTHMMDSVAPTAHEFRVRLPDGRFRWLASRSAPVLDEHGKMQRRVGVNWDITESKNAELTRRQKLVAERESQAKSQFLSRMSHELRTPLNAILGFAQLLLNDAAQRSEAAQFHKLTHIRTAGEHLLALINDVLDLSSLDAGSLTLARQPVALAEIVAQALPLVDALAAAREVRVVTGSLAGVARADPVRLLQVLINLLSNAVKYNRPQGTVAIETRADQRRIALRVQDTGRGLTAGQQLHLFEPFNRLGAESAGETGTGIGLTIVKALVEGMGGTVSVSSRVGEGTTFEVTLDVAEAAPAETPRPAAPPAEAERGGHRSGQLLYIEDNAVNVLLVEEMVRSVPGLAIVSEITGASGVERARVLRPDLILVDMQLPDCDGFAVLQRLRAQPETAGIRCVALSANAMREDVERSLRAGFADYWTKPIDFKRFLASLEAAFPLVHTS